MDTIFIRGLIFSGKHGLEDDERANHQRFGIDIETTQEPRAYEDSIKNTYNYMAAYEIARTAVEEESGKLIETVAERIASQVLEHVIIQSVTVTIRKLDIFVHGEGGVTITRSK